jgi:hypothetical protein
MHSNGGRGLVPEVIWPAVGESRRGGARRLSRVGDRSGRRSLALVGEELRTVSAMVFFALGCLFATIASCRWHLGSIGARRNHRRVECALICKFGARRRQVTGYGDIFFRDSSDGRSISAQIVALHFALYHRPIWLAMPPMAGFRPSVDRQPLLQCRIGHLGLAFACERADFRQTNGTRVTPGDFITAPADRSRWSVGYCRPLSIILSNAPATFDMFRGGSDRS